MWKWFIGINKMFIWYSAMLEQIIMERGINMNTNTKDFLYEVYSKLESENKFIAFNEVFAFLRKLSFEYPNFSGWFNSLFYMGYELNPDREIIIGRYDKQIAGVIILKKTIEENKICTLRVGRQFRNNGIATELVKRGIEWLEDEKPLITCHYTRNRQFDKLFKYYGFELTEKKRGYYGIFNLEYAYNGVLPDKKILLNKIEIIDISNAIKVAIDNNITNFNAILDRCILLWYRRENQIRNKINLQEESLCVPYYYQ